MSSQTPCSQPGLVADRPLTGRKSCPQGSGTTRGHPIPLEARARGERKGRDAEISLDSERWGESNRQGDKPSEPPAPRPRGACGREITTFQGPAPVRAQDRVIDASGRPPARPQEGAQQNAGAPESRAGWEPARLPSVPGPQAGLWRAPQGGVNTAPRSVGCSQAAARPRGPPPACSVMTFLSTNRHISLRFTQQPVEGRLAQASPPRSGQCSELRDP